MIRSRTASGSDSISRRFATSVRLSASVSGSSRISVERIAEELARLAHELPAGRIRLRAHRPDEQDRQLRRERHELARDLDRRRVGPVEVLADEDERPASGEGSKQPVGRRGVAALEDLGSTSVWIASSARSGSPRRWAR